MHSLKPKSGAAFAQSQRPVSEILFFWKELSRSFQKSQSGKSCSAKHRQVSVNKGTASYGLNMTVLFFTAFVAFTKASVHTSNESWELKSFSLLSSTSLNPVPIYISNVATNPNSKHFFICCATEQSSCVLLFPLPLSDPLKGPSSLLLPVQYPLSCLSPSAL